MYTIIVQDTTSGSQAYGTFKDEEEARKGLVRWFKEAFDDADDKIKQYEEDIEQFDLFNEFDVDDDQGGTITITLIEFSKI